MKGAIVLEGTRQEGVASAANGAGDPLHRYKNCSPAHFSRWRSHWYLFVLRFLWRPVMRLTYRPEVYGRHHVPKTGRFIVVSNHIDAFDPAIVAHVVGSPIAFMAKKEAFKYRLGAELLRLVGSFALDRDRPGSSTLKTAFNVLKSETPWALGMFPEGTRSRTGTLLPLKKGVGGLAVRTGLPVVPVGLHKNAGRLIVTVGEPIVSIADPEAVHEAMHLALLHLIDPTWDRTSFAEPAADRQTARICS